MEKEKSVKKKVTKKETDIKEEIDNNVKSGLTPKQKEIILTIVVLFACVIVGFFIGKYLYELMNGPI